MCGIVGIYNFGNNRPVEREKLTQMCNIIRHRGPDSDGFFLNNNIGLGIRRLAIIDLQTGNQPIHNEDNKIWTVLNGEIYNFLELRQQLEKKHNFYTKTDTEVIVHLYEDYGEKCVQYLRGMFAFAIWDEKNKKLFIAKDRVGKKPLYYTSHNGSFVFASEIKSILEYLQKTPEIDFEAIDLFLTYQYIPSPKTIFKNIKSLLPAHILTCDKNGDIETKEYWNLDFTKKTNLSFDNACTETKNLLMEATKLRMISDVPLGAFLSGGVDSSIVVGLMSQLSSQPVKTFSIGFEEADFSELTYAKIVANHFKTDHHEFIVKPNFIEILPKLVWHYGQPFADSSALPSYFVANETKKHVTVALNGDGGDETFGGYLRYKAMKGSLYFAFPFQILGKKITEKLSSLVPFKDKKYFRYLRRLVSALSEPPELRNIQWHRFFSNEAKEKLYTDNMKKILYNNAYDYLTALFENAPANNIMDRVFYTDLKAYLPECLLVKMDIASMANSLEARSPFLDHKVLEFSASLPSAWKLHGLTTKYILKKSFNDFLPKEILHRGKMGFGIPVGKWFRNNWKNYYREIVLSQKSINRGYFERETIEQMFYEHISGKRDHGYRLWALLMLELWHNVYIDGKNV
ncbi:MAG: asparagine synthase (glutamine-hydrolyzing) [Elusimicrobia bacterium CG06_land_8_20_14_3_00_38_11]|nr:MAG: asparagine synthase (glutamine-hydrolyzing) [Elusimicrobia bacterium CG06_land_8_20_14_3_00_38_11]